MDDIFGLDEINDFSLREYDKTELWLSNNPIIQVVRAHDYQLKKLVIKNCPNLKYIDISSQKSITIEIESCENVKNLRISNCNLFSLTISLCSVVKMTFINVIIDQYIHLDSITNSRLEIRQNKDASNLIIRDINITNSKLDSVFLFDINGDQINIKDSSMLYLLFNNISMETIDLVNISFILLKKPITGLRFFKVTCSSYFNISINDSNETEETSLIFDDIKLYGESNIILENSISKTSKYEIRLTKINTSRSLLISQKNWSKAIVGVLEFHPSDEGLIIIKGLLFSEVTSIGYLTKSSIDFVDSQINHLIFKNFNNKGSFKISNNRQINLLEVSNSDLDNVVFRPLKAENIKIYPDSFIGGMKIYGSEAISLDKTDLSSDQKQEFYRQLKQSAKNSNNKFLELEYKAKEMANYKPTNLIDKISHSINSISSHGIDWFKPLFYMVLINIIIWLLVIYNLYFNKFEHLKSNGQYSCSSLLDFTFGLWIILNPLSRFSEFKTYLDYECESHFIVPNIVPMLFFISKIINGILIYQMVSAFRKWVGKD